MSKTWTTTELLQEIGQFESELRAAGKKEQTIHTYVDRAERFVRWLDGGYDPKGESGRSVRKLLDVGTKLQATRSHRS
jgi:hypothetical protein